MMNNFLRQFSPKINANICCPVFDIDRLVSSDFNPMIPAVLPIPNQLQRSLFEYHFLSVNDKITILAS